MKGNFGKISEEVMNLGKVWNFLAIAQVVVFRKLVDMWMVKDILMRSQMTQEQILETGIKEVIDIY
jgi:hypothetical protein